MPTQAKPHRESVSEKRKMPKTIPPMQEADAIMLLSSQHREVDQLFDELEATDDRSKKERERIMSTLIRKLNWHTQLEERVFYPAARNAEKDRVLQSFEEHDNITAMLRKLSTLSGTDETFLAKVKVLKKMVQHHVKEEEQDLFPHCRASLGEEKLFELGAQMQELCSPRQKSPPGAEVH